MKRKNVIIIVMAIVVALLIISSIRVLLLKEEIFNQDYIEIKKLNESTKKTDLESQIVNLNSEMTSYKEYTQTCRQRIAEALTKEKVETANDASIETVTQNVDRILEERTKDATATEDYISNGKTAYVNGKKITGNGSKFDVVELKGKKYIYNQGNTYDELTGGWIRAYSSGSVTNTNTNSYLTIASTGTTDFLTKNSIDFSGYSVIYFEFASTSALNTKNTFFGVRNTTGDTSYPFSRIDYGRSPICTNARYKYTTLSNGHYLVKVDLSGNITKGYPCIEVVGNTLNVYSVYMK